MEPPKNRPQTGRLAEQSTGALLMETDPCQREKIRTLLLEKGLQVEISSDRRSLLETVKKKPVHLAILDWSALEGQGLYDLRRIQKVRPGLAIILTGEAPPMHEVIQALKGGAFDFLIKPYTLDLLNEAAKRALQNQRSFLEILHLSENLKEVNRKLKIQKRRLQEEKLALKKWGDEMNLINEMNREMVSTLDMEKIVKAAIQRIGGLITYDIITLTLWRQRRQWIFAAFPIGQPLLEEIQGTLPRMILQEQEEEPYHLKIIEGQETPPSQPVHPGEKNYVSQCLRVGKSKIGAIQIWRLHPSKSVPVFDLHETQILSTVANTLALALNNAIIHHQVQSMATTDGLTGLVNKRFFASALEKEFKMTLRYQTPLSLIMLDLDHFKEINDLYGHQAGDAVIREISRILRKSLREIDVPARYGGDELAIILPGTPPEQAFFVAKRIKKLVEGNLFNALKEGSRITVSMGIASCPSPDIRRVDDFISAADKALYSAKRGGRNRVESDTSLFQQNNIYLEVPVA